MVEEELEITRRYRNRRRIPMKTRVILSGLAYFSCFLVILSFSMPIAYQQLSQVQVTSFGPEIIWEEILGGDASYGSGIVSTGDGGVVALCSSHEFPAALSDIYLIRINGDRSIVWESKLGRYDKTENGRDVVSDGKGGFVVLGGGFPYVGHGSQVYLYGVDSKGNQTFQRTYGTKIYSNYAHDITPTLDDGYLILGSNGTYDCNYIYAVRVDSGGNRIWERSYNNFGLGWASCIVSAEDGGFIMVGQYSANEGSGVLVMKIDGDGDIIWHKTFTGNNPLTGRAAIKVSSGGLAILGSTSEEGPYWSSQDVYLLRIDEEGEMIWETTLNTPRRESGHSLVETDDGGFIVVGDAYGQGWDRYILRLDSEGNKVWEKTISDPEYDSVIDIAKVGEGEYILVGYTNSFGEGRRDSYLLKIRDPVYAPIREISLTPLVLALITVLMLSCWFLKKRAAGPSGYNHRG